MVGRGPTRPASPCAQRASARAERRPGAASRRPPLPPAAPRSVGCAWHAQRAEYCRKLRYLGIALARGGPCSRASTPPTSDAVLSPEIEYVRCLYMQYRGLPATAAKSYRR